MSTDITPDLPEFEDEHPLDKAYEKLHPVVPVDDGVREIHPYTAPGTRQVGDFRPRRFEDIEVPKAPAAPVVAAPIEPELPPQAPEDQKIPSPKTPDAPKAPAAPAPAKASSPDEDLPF